MTDQRLPAALILRPVILEDSDVSDEEFEELERLGDQLTRKASNLRMVLEAWLYFGRLEDVLRLVSPIPPNLSPAEFLKIKKRAKWIFKKLEHFKDPRVDSIKLPDPEEGPEKENLEMTFEVYYARLGKALHRLPDEPPREVREKDFVGLKAYALLIIKTLERFKGDGGRS